MSKSKLIVSAALTTMFMAQQTMCLSVIASEISGINQTKGTFNINPTARISDTDIGYRKYVKFELDQGDVANLIYQYGNKDINTFVNLVDDKILINGIVNSVRDGNYYNGKAVFVSPNGMVVGASGVLNVGSLGVYTPTQSTYDDYKKNPRADLSGLKNTNSGASVTVNGKVFANHDIEMYSGNINVPGYMYAGTTNKTVIEGRQKAEEIFNTIVNTTNMRPAKNLITNNGNINLNSSVGTNISGTMKNAGKGNTVITNTGSGGIKISGKASNFYGNTTYKNSAGAINISGNVSNYDGLAKLDNSGAGGVNISKTGIINASNAGNNALTITNSGKAGVNITGNINSVGNSNVTNNINGVSGLNVDGSFVTTSGNATFLNEGEKGLNVNGNITNTAGTLTMTNKGKNGLNINKTSKVNAGTGKITNNGYNGLNINGNVKTTNGIEFLNTGDNGLNINGNVDNTGKATVTNTIAGTNGLNINGTFINNGVATFTNDGLNGLNVSKTATVSSNGITITNSGANGMNINGTVKNFGNGNYTNNAGALKVNETAYMTNTNGTANYYNKGSEGTSIKGKIENKGTSFVHNTNGTLNVAGSFNNNGTTTFTNDGGSKDFNISGTIYGYNGNLALYNQNGALNISSKGEVDNNKHLSIKNDGENGLNITGNVNNYKNIESSYSAGDVEIINIGNGGLNINKTATVTSNGLVITNSGYNGLNINGSVTNTGNAEIKNTKDGANGLNVNGQILNRAKLANNSYVGDLNINNAGKEGLNVNGIIDTNNTNITAINSGEKGLNVTGTISGYGNNNGLTNINLENSGTNGINIYGTVKTTADSSAQASKIVTSNTGTKGTLIASEGRINSVGNVYIKDNSADGTRVKGLVNGNNVYATQKGGGDFVIGDRTNNNSYITSNKNIDINTNKGSILNYGVEKTLLKAGGNLTMNATDGTIGLPVQQKACEGTGCTGIGPKVEESRNFKKSINGQIYGKVKASTTDSTAAKQNDYVINYASIDSDMKIDTIKADGRVILTVDDDFGYTNTGKKYSMINARPKDNSDTNIEGWGISLIADKNIGSKDNAVTFIQNNAENGYKMDALANKDIYLKENSFNDANYGRAKEVAKNEVCTMIAREGDLNVEFAGNTHINNITSEGDLTVITRGKTLEIDNLGHITDKSVIPNDYFGPRDYGQKDGGYTKPDYRNEALPNNATIKALDINHNIRPTEKILDGGYEAWAGSNVRINNAVLDNGTLDVTADNVYANGIAAHFGKDGFSKEVDPSTNNVIGSNGIPTAHAVRPDDVTGVGRDEHERNYYYHNGDGDGIFDGIPSNVDDDDDIVDDTPLAIEDPTEPPTVPPTDPPTEPPTVPPTDPPTEPPTVPPTDPPTEPPTVPPTEPPTVPPTEPPTVPPTEPPTVPPTEPAQIIPDEDGRIAYTQRKGEANIDNIDKRQFMRFNVSETTNPVLMEKSTNGVNRLLDVSRGGIAVNHSNSLKVGDVIPVHLQYGDLDIRANAKVVSATTSRAGAEFVNIDKALANQLLFLNIMLEANNNMLAVR